MAAKEQASRGEEEEEVSESESVLWEEPAVSSQ